MLQIAHYDFYHASARNTLLLNHIIERQVDLSARESALNLVETVFEGSHTHLIASKFGVASGVQVHQERGWCCDTL